MFDDPDSELLFEEWDWVFELYPDELCVLEPECRLEELLFVAPGPLKLVVTRFYWSGALLFLEKNTCTCSPQIINPGSWVTFRTASASWRE